MINQIVKTITQLQANLTFLSFTAGPLSASIDASLNKYNDKIKLAFSQKWSKHKCSVPGCQTVLVFDGGCKVKSPN